MQSYDVDDQDNELLGYTSYEKSDSVNKRRDNGDGGHGHDHYADKDSYNREMNRIIPD